jgi:hypothetical protein
MVSHFWARLNRCPHQMLIVVVGNSYFAKMPENRQSCHKSQKEYTETRIAANERVVPRGCFSNSPKNSRLGTTKGYLRLYAADALHP